MGDHLDQVYDNQLLALLGEELKQPLVAIAQLAELESSSAISLQAKRALRTIDNVLLYRRVSSGQVALLLEPVHVGSAIQSVQQIMNPLMKQQGSESELRIQKSLQLVDVDRRLLFGLVESMWQAFVQSLKGSEPIICRAKKTRQGIRVSLSSKSADLDEVHFSEANIMSTQPVTAFAGPSADLITAQHLCDLLGVTISKTANSIGVTLPLSKQLQMV